MNDLPKSRSKPPIHYAKNKEKLHFSCYIRYIYAIYMLYMLYTSFFFKHRDPRGLAPAAPGQADSLSAEERELLQVG